MHIWKKQENKNAFFILGFYEELESKKTTGSFFKNHESSRFFFILELLQVGSAVSNKQISTHLFVAKTFDKVSRYFLKKKNCILISLCKHVLRVTIVPLNHKNKLRMKEIPLRLDSELKRGSATCLLQSK